MTTVRIDHREHESMPALFKNLGYEVSLETLPVGDYIIEDRLIFSLKVGDDFLSSVFRGHLHNEIESMAALPDRFTALVLCEMPMENRAEMARITEITETINAMYLPVMFAKDREAAVVLMDRWYKKSQAKYKEFPLQIKRKVEVARNRFAPIVKAYRMLGIGDETASKLAERYPTFRSLADGIAANPGAWGNDIIKTKNKREDVERVVG